MKEKSPAPQVARQIVRAFSASASCTMNLPRNERDQRKHHDACAGFPLMAGKSLLRTGAAAIFLLLLVPVACPASSLTVTTITPSRPQIHLSPSLRLDVRPRDTYDPGLSESCRPDERLRRGKRERRCRQDR